MPTSRRRHMITETDDVVEALADAASRWPELSAPELLRRLLLEGHAAVRGHIEAERAAVAATAGALTGVFAPGDLDEMRRDWPA